MILLRDLLADDVEERSVWQTYAKKFGARNTLGQVRYFNDHDAATAFARGEISGPEPGRAIPKQKPQRKEPIQKYDVTPVVPYDAEAIH
jgi:hypothetical protein